MTGERTFDSTTNGVPSEVKVIGVKLTDGKNSLYAEAYRERAEQVKKLNLQKEEIERVDWIRFDELERRMQDGTIKTCIDPDELSILKEFLEKGTLHSLSQD